MAPGLSTSPRYATRPGGAHDRERICMHDARSDTALQLLVQALGTRSIGRGAKPKFESEDGANP
jgi:hypothetical protein